MTTRILIQHLTGSKINQIEQFPLDGFAELTLGRDPTSAISFDPQRDDAVSRRHAIIRIQQGDQPSFRIADLGSRNGTLINGEPIAAEVELLPGDIVELGKGGPKFSFDVQPRPANLLGRTRQITTGAIPGATRVLDTAEIEAAAMAAASGVTASTKPSVGRETVMGMLVAQRRQTNKSWMYVLAGVLFLVGAGGAALYQHNKIKTEQAEAAAKAETTAAKAEAAEALDREKAEEAKKLASAEAAVRKDMGMSPQEIVRRFGNATVVIDTQWRLYDKSSGKPLYQMVKTIGGQRTPCFVELANGAVIRWLTTDDQNQTNDRIGAALRGSGFVIDPQGFIMTNKHVAAGWLIPYGRFFSVGRAAVFKLGNLANPQIVDLSAEQNWASKRTLIDKWTPGDPQSGNSGGAVFRPDAPVPVDNQFHTFEGRPDVLDVRFPGSLVSVAAHFVRASPVADVAEIKIDSQQALATVELAQDDNVLVGEKVTVLGYPNFSTQTIALVQSAESGNVQSKKEEVPEPTVTEGLVSQKSAGVQQQSQGITTVGEMGDAYQLTVPTSAGNSGGPVFNAAGKVIGLFTYGNAQRETTTFAIPIKPGRDLFQVQRAAN